MEIQGSDSSLSAAVPTTPASAPAEGAGTAPPATPDFMSFVPEAYREDPTVKDAAKSEKPFETFFESFKYAQSQAGKKGLEIPGEGATEEQVKSFYKSLGVPDTVDGYELPDIDISKEEQELQDLLKAGSSPEYEKMIKDVFHKEGITPKQAKALKEANDKFQVEATRAMLAHAKEEQTKAAQAQADSFKKVYGDQSDYVQKIAKETLEKVVPKEIRDIGDPDIALFEALRFIHEKVYKNDPPASGGGVTSSANAIDSINAEIDKLTSLNSYVDKMDKDYESTGAKVSALYQRLADLQAKK